MAAALLLLLRLSECAVNNNSWVAPTVFLHFHKAGGTSVCALYRAAGRCTLYPAYTLLLILALQAKLGV